MPALATVQAPTTSQSPSQQAAQPRRILRRLIARPTRICRLFLPIELDDRLRGAAVGCLERYAIAGVDVLDHRIVLDLERLGSSRRIRADGSILNPRDRDRAVEAV